MVKKLTPKFIKEAIKFIIRPLYFGNNRYCPVCEISSRKFAKFGADKRIDAKCPHCGALERHRLVWAYFRDQTNLFDKQKKTMLHIAPEVFFRKKLEKILGDDYYSADLYDKSAKIKMDVMDIGFPDNSFDVIYCSHVLEHVADDKKAIREFYRTLRKDRWAIIMVPIHKGKTFEDPTITDPKERLRLFGQEDHVRIYGEDFADRLTEAGFKIKIIKPADFLNDSEITRLGLKYCDDVIYYCSK